MGLDGRYAKEVDLGTASTKNTGTGAAELPTNAGVTSTLESHGIDGVTPLSHRNRIINGDMRIDQRNGGAAVAVTDTAIYSVDRFRSQNATGTGTITGQQSLLSGLTSLKVGVDAAVTDLSTGKYVYGVTQEIEGYNCYDLVGGDITASFRVETNWTGNLPVAFRTGGPNTAARSYVVDAAVVPGVNTISVTLPLESVATSPVANNGSWLQLTIGFNNEDTYRTATTGAWIDGGLLTTTASTQWAKTAGNFINVTDVQLEAGSVATPFERRSYGTELALCQRYYEKSRFEHRSNYSSSTVLHDIYTTLKLSVVKRASPTIALTVEWANNVTNVSARDLSLSSFSIAYAQQNSGSSHIKLTWSAEAEL
jgi:hypothetical protein